MGDRRSGRKRQAIVDAATAAFRDHGYDTAGMDRIAELAGVSKRTVYNHFSGKDELFREVVRQFLARARTLKEIEWDPDRPLADQLAAFAQFKATMATDASWSGLVRVVLGVIIHKPEFARETAEQLAAGDDALLEWFKAVHTAGRLRVAEPAAAARMFWAMAGGALFWPQVFGPRMRREEVSRTIQQIVTMFLDYHRLEDS